MKGPFPFGWISPFGMADSFQSTNDISSKELVSMDPLCGKIFRKYCPVRLKNAVTIILL
jgi:hypothetical protein